MHEDLYTGKIPPKNKLDSTVHSFCSVLSKCTVHIDYVCGEEKDMKIEETILQGLHSRTG